MFRRGKKVLPGFHLTLGFTLFYLSLIVLIPLSALLLKAAGLGWESFWTTISSPRVLASYRITFGASLLAAFPAVLPALLTGFAMAFARALGEYGSVVFISGNMPMKTEITSLLIITKLEQHDLGGATAIAVVMLVASFGLLLAINALQWWSSHRYRGVA